MNDRILNQVISLARTLPPTVSVPVTLPPDWLVRTLAATLSDEVWQELAERDGLSAAALAQARLWRERKVLPDVEYRCTSSGKGCLVMAAWAAPTAVVCYAPTLRITRRRLGAETGVPAGWNPAHGLDDDQVVKHPERGWTVGYQAQDGPLTLACGHHWPTVRVEAVLGDVKRAVKAGRTIRRAL